MSREKGKTLTDDGVNEELFNLLWSKDELNFGPSINIPDTIFFKYGQPTSWYFTANNGRIKKKNKQNLLNARIEECFNKYILGYDVVATFVSIPLERDPETGEFPTSTIQYLDRAGLNEFLYKMKKDVHGMLQRFVEPKGTKNEMIKALWSPKLCLLERAENIHHLHDTRYGLFEKCVTYEGPEYYYHSAPLRGPVLAGQIQKICEAVVSHVSEVSYGQKQITRMVINFRVDSRDKIWLLNSSSVRCQDMMHAPDSAAIASGTLARQLVNIDSVETLPESVNLNPQRSHSKIIPKKRIRCLSCAKESLEDLRHPVTYKSIVKHYDHVIHLAIEISGKNNKGILSWPPDDEVVDAAGGVGFGCLKMSGDDDSMGKTAKFDLAKPLDMSELRIPPIIRFVHPKLSARNYSKCYRDPLFLYKTVQVCESCYLVYAEFTTMLLRLGQDLKKLLTPDPAAVEAIKQFQGTRTTSADGTKRPSSADWRAMSTVNRSTSVSSLRPSANHVEAKETAIGLRSSEVRVPPNVPGTIRRGNEADLLRAQQSVASWVTDERGSMTLGSPEVLGQGGGSLLTNSMSMGFLEGFPSNANANGSGNGSGSNNNMMGISYEDSVQSMIQERERLFFKEISKNPQLRDQHPLMHLITSQKKIELANAQSGVLTNKTAQQQESHFGTRYGKQSGDSFDRLGPYGQEIPYILRGRTVLPSVLKKEKEEFKKKQQELKEERRLRRKLRKQAEQEGLLDTATTGSGTARSATDSVSSGAHANMSSSAVNHRKFLKDALKNIDDDMTMITRDNNSSTVNISDIVDTGNNSRSRKKTEENTFGFDMSGQSGLEASLSQDIGDMEINSVPGSADSQANRPSTSAIGRRDTSSRLNSSQGSFKTDAMQWGIQEEGFEDQHLESV